VQVAGDALSLKGGTLTLAALRLGQLQRRVAAFTDDGRQAAVVSAAKMMYSWRLSALSVGECSTKGPNWFEVASTAITAATATARVAPWGPRRSAAQMNAGNTM
jgi:hypothetical protein